MRSAGDPVRTGLVASLARPGGNVTGYSIVAPELDIKRLALLRELLPSLQRVGWLETTNPYYHAVREDLEKACRSLGIKPLFVQVAAPHELENAVAAVARQDGQALIVPTDGPFYENRVAIIRAALKHSLPTMVDRKTMLEAGALVFYAESQAELWRRVAAYIDKILRGAKPADLPVEQPTEFELGINLKTANALGLAIPPSLLLRADQVIQ
jgi:putative tryptophan/tyrosine transport system substrate-binding protein